MKSAAHAVRVVMTVAVPALVLIVRHHAVQPLAARLVEMWPLPMAAISLLKLPEPINPPLSAFAKSPRQLQQLTVKENNHVATRSPEIPQRAKRP